MFTLGANHGGGERRLRGVYTGGGGDRQAVAVSGEQVRDFILQALAPVAWRELAVEPSGVKVTTLLRGSFPRDDDHTLEIDDHALTNLSMELDLGDGDTVVTGVAARGAARAAGVPVPTGLRVASSMFRPEPGVAWTGERCERQPRPPRGVAQPWGAECRFKSPRVARGIRVEVGGDLSGLRRVTLLVTP